MALLAALAYGVVATMLVASGLYLAMGFTSQTWSEARSESAAVLADAGINNELALIAATSGVPTSSAPTAATGETMVYPGESHPVYGRKGTMATDTDGTYWVCTTANEWWRSGNAPVAWNGVTSPYWITATAYVQGSWRRATVQVSKQSVFNAYVVFATDSNGTTDDIVDVDAAASATINGAAGTNGKVNLHGGSGLSLGNALNANTALCASAQFTTSSVRSGSSLVTKTAPVTYARTANVMSSLTGIPILDEALAWVNLLTVVKNSTGIYTYKLAAASSTLSPTNCVRTSLPTNTLENYNILNILLPTKVCWDYCNVKPGTGSKVKTLIFEPGDYFLNDINLNYDASTELVIDPQALASGGTPGPIRFWVYDVPLLGGNDHIDIPIQMTKASGATTPDSSQFRIYYAKDGYTLTLNRPSNCKDYTGATLSGDFNLYGSLYSVTKLPNDTSLLGGLLVYGTKVVLAGTTGSSNGKMVVNGSIIADHIGFKGPCTVNAATGGTSDPGSGGRILGGYLDGK